MLVNNWFSSVSTHSSPLIPRIPVNNTTSFPPAHFNALILQHPASQSYKFYLDNLPHKRNAKATIKRLKCHFSTHGIPAIVYSDNHPPFNSQEFVNFANDYEFQHITSSPEYQQSNGKAESAVMIANTLIRINTDSNGEISIILCWHGEIRQLKVWKVLLLNVSSDVEPEQVCQSHPRNVQAKKLNKQVCQKHYYDKNVKELPQLMTGDTISTQIQMQQKASQTQSRIIHTTTRDSVSNKWTKWDKQRKIVNETQNATASTSRDTEKTTLQDTEMTH